MPADGACGAALGVGNFMVTWGVGVSRMDSALKPWIISQGSRMPFLLPFFGVVGGDIAASEGIGGRPP